MEIKKDQLKRIVTTIIILTIFMGIVLCISTDNTYAATKKLATPKITSAKNLDSEMIQLKWSKVKNAKQYYVYRSTTANGTYTFCATAVTNSYQDTKVKLQKTYYYKVKAVNTGKYKASNLSKAKKVAFKFDGQIVADSNVTIYTDCPIYLPVNKGNTKAVIALSKTIDHLYTMDHVVQNKVGDNTSNLSIEYKGDLSEDLVLQTNICYALYPWIKKPLTITIKDSSKVPGYQQNTAVPDFGIYTGTKPYNTERNGKVNEYRISTTQQFDYQELLQKRGCKIMSQTSDSKSKCIIYQAPNGTLFAFLVYYIDFDSKNNGVIKNIGVILS